MNVINKLAVIASLALAPALSFAQPTDTHINNQPANTQSAPAYSASAVHAQRDASGYGAPAAGSSQSSTMRTQFLGKHSKTFDH